MLKRQPWLILVFAAVFALLIAGGVIFTLERRTAADPAAQPLPVSSTEGTTLKGLEATVYKSPTCGCCSGYVEFLEAQGVTVNAVDTDNLTQVKAEYGVPAAAQSCHTTVIDGYVVEGHVPLEGLEQLLTERPDIDGIALPGMPTGTPGMPGPKQGPFEVLTLQDEQLGLWKRF